RAALCALGAGAVLALLARGRIGRYVPSPAAIGIGMLLPASSSVTLFLGALLLALARRVKPREVEQYCAAVAGGTIAGESLVRLLVGAVVAIGLFGHAGSVPARGFGAGQISAQAQLHAVGNARGDRKRLLEVVARRARPTRAQLRERAQLAQLDLLLL